MKTESREKGFSLSELILVMGITAILAAVGIPNYLNARNKFAIDGEGDQLVNYIRNGVENARTYKDGVDWGISINNTDTDWYELLEGGVGGTSTDRVYLGSAVNFTATTASTSVTFGGGPNINILASDLVIGLTTANGVFTDTITVDTLGRITRSKNYE